MAGYAAFALFAAVFVAPFMNYACRQGFVVVDFAYLAIAVLLGVSMVFAIEKFRRGTDSKMVSLRGALCSGRGFRIAVLIVAAMLFAMQAAIVYGAWFVTGWDISVVCDFDNLLSNGDYFSRYPNQLFMAGLFMRIAKLGALLGFAQGYLCVVAVGCFCVTVSVVLLAFTARRLAGYMSGYLALLIGVVLVGLSPWILVPYSDTYSMPWIMLTLFAFACIKNKSAKWFTIFFSSLVGYMIKPTAIFALAAILLVQALKLPGWLRALKSRDQVSATAPIREIVAICLSVILAICLSSGLADKTRDFGVEVDDNASFTMTHFLMMGFNVDSLGVYSHEDVAYSNSFDTVAERQAGNIDILAQRLADMGPLGVAKQLLCKTMTNYADGSFAWESEGMFYLETYGGNAFIKSIYGIDDAEQGFSREAYFEPVAQMVWFFVLLGVAFAMRRRDVSEQETVAFLALAMLSVFLMLFEARARYLLCYMPYFVLLGSIGWSWLSRRASDGTGVA